MNNLTRAVIGGFAVPLAGYIPSAEPPYDEPLGLGWSIEAQQLAEDAAKILHYEAKLTEVQDPLAGSYFIEATTDQIEKEAWELIEKIDGMGGAVGAIENGFMQRSVAESAYEYQKKVESGEEKVVGVNAFTGAAGDRGSSQPGHSLSLRPRKTGPGRRNAGRQTERDPEETGQPAGQADA